MKIRIALLSGWMAVACLAADVTGKWTAEMPGRDGQTRQMAINLKADGDKLTGTMSGPGGEQEITNGKVSGDEISYDVVREFNGNSITIHYVGKVSADSIQFKVQRPTPPQGGGGGGKKGGRMPTEFTAKRATS